MSIRHFTYIMVGMMHHGRGCCQIAAHEQMHIDAALLADQGFEGRSGKVSPILHCLTTRVLLYDILVLLGNARGVKRYINVCRDLWTCQEGLHWR